MELFALRAENIKIDGGSTFGVVPKAIWQKFCKADENNLIDVALRCMLVKDGDRLILIDTGCGNKQSEKFYSYLYITGRDNLLNTVKEAGYTFSDITDVILTHLHYDHCGGAVIVDKSTGKLMPAFSNARYWVSRAQWERANNPYCIDKPSYFNENFLPLLESGVLNFIEKEQYFTPGIFLKIVNGHTAGQLIPIINYKGLKVAFVADFIPSSAHVQPTYIPAFDYEPLVSLREKQEFTNLAADENYVLYFQHDFITECATIARTEKGIIIKETFALKDITS